MNEMKIAIDEEWKQLNIELEKEIAQGKESKYWVGDPESDVTQPNDFDFSKMVSEFHASYPQLNPDAVEAALIAAIYKFHL